MGPGPPKALKNRLQGAIGYGDDRDRLPPKHKDQKVPKPRSEGRLSPMEAAAAGPQMMPRIFNARFSSVRFSHIRLSAQGALAAGQVARLKSAKRELPLWLKRCGAVVAVGFLRPRGIL